MSIGRFAPNACPPADETKRFYWQNHGMVVVSIDEPGMPWDLREQLDRYMRRQHGLRKCDQVMQGSN